MTEALRLPYWDIATEATSTLGESSTYLRQRSSLDPQLLELLFLRVSQINGCAYCVESHSRSLRETGESDERLDSLAAWTESPAFAPAEKAALAWAEALTRIEATRAPADLFEALKSHWSERQITDITYAAGLMNAWNRIAIAFRHGPAPRRT